MPAIFHRAILLAVFCTGICVSMSWAGAQDHQSSMDLLVRAIQGSRDTTVQRALLKGMLDGLAGRRDVPPPVNWSTVSEQLGHSDDEVIRDLTQQLSQIFGDRKATARALAVVQDTDIAVGDRRQALWSLLNQQNETASDLLESLLDENELALDAIRGYAVVENAVAPVVLLERYSSLSPEHRRAVVETLSSRKRYAEVLLAALREGSVPRDDIPSHVARSLKSLLGDSFTQVFGDIQDLAQDRRALMARYRKMITPAALAKADASRGRVVFKKTCASCHTLYGDGATDWS